jgi:hypothetical protein
MDCTSSVIRRLQRKSFHVVEQNVNEELESVTCHMTLFILQI